MPNRVCEDSNLEVVISSWREKFYKILDSATDTEGNINNTENINELYKKIYC